MLMLMSFWPLPQTHAKGRPERVLYGAVQTLSLKVELGPTFWQHTRIFFLSEVQRVGMGAGPIH